MQNSFLVDAANSRNRFGCRSLASVILVLLLAPLALGSQRLTNQRQAGRGRGLSNAGQTSTKPDFRKPDTRPRHDDKRLAKLGIFKYESLRIRLYTDIEPDVAKNLPAMIDQAYVAWESYFGRLPPDRRKLAFQMTGYIMKDRLRFQKAGLLPRALPGRFHGRQVAGQFWMNYQTAEYYLKHLMLHEGTHCFMQAIANVDAPMWYMEGMAELFGTHRVDKQGRLILRIVPHNKDSYKGHGRITLIREEVKKRGVLTPAVILEFTSRDFERRSETYAWCWAFCKFLDSHPRYRVRFRRLGDFTTGNQFESTMLKLFAQDFHALLLEWPLFVAGLCEGFDCERAAIDIRPGRPLVGLNVSECQIAADRGWQSSGSSVQEGMRYEITGAGQFTLAQLPKPWISEPQGVSIRYSDSRPMGILLATIVPSDLDRRKAVVPPPEILTIGRKMTFVADTSGTIYFRLNDFWSELADNRGSVTISIRKQ